MVTAMKKTLSMLGLFALSILSACRKDDVVQEPKVNYRTANNIAMTADDDGQITQISFPTRIVKTEDAITYPNGLGITYNLCNTTTGSYSVAEYKGSSATPIQNTVAFPIVSEIDNLNYFAFKTVNNASDEIIVTNVVDGQVVSIDHYDVTNNLQGTLDSGVGTGLIRTESDYIANQSIAYQDVLAAFNQAKSNNLCP
jgi:hypothetical protein